MSPAVLLSVVVNVAPQAALRDPIEALLPDDPVEFFRNVRAYLDVQGAGAFDVQDIVWQHAAVGQPINSIMESERFVSVYAWPGFLVEATGAREGDAMAAGLFEHAAGLPEGATFVPAASPRPQVSSSLMPPPFYDSTVQGVATVTNSGAGESVDPLLSLYSRVHDVSPLPWGHGDKGDGNVGAQASTLHALRDDGVGDLAVEARIDPSFRGMVHGEGVGSPFIPLSSRDDELCGDTNAEAVRSFYLDAAMVDGRAASTFSVVLEFVVVTEYAEAHGAPLAMPNRTANATYFEADKAEYCYEKSRRLKSASDTIEGYVSAPPPDAVIGFAHVEEVPQVEFSIAERSPSATTTVGRAAESKRALDQSQASGSWAGAATTATTHAWSPPALRRASPDQHPTEDMISRQSIAWRYADEPLPYNETVAASLDLGGDFYQAYALGRIAVPSQLLLDAAVLSKSDKIRINLLLINTLADRPVDVRVAAYIVACEEPPRASKVSSLSPFPSGLPGPGSSAPGVAALGGQCTLRMSAMSPSLFEQTCACTLPMPTLLRPVAHLLSLVPEGQPSGNVKVNSLASISQAFSAAAIARNPWAFVLVVSLWLIYAVLLVRARVLDVQERVATAVNLTNKTAPQDRFKYLVVVPAGLRPGAGTLAPITLSLYGDDSEVSARRGYFPARPSRSLSWILLPRAPSPLPRTLLHWSFTICGRVWRCDALRA